MKMAGRTESRYFAAYPRPAKNFTFFPRAVTAGQRLRAIAGTHGGRGVSGLLKWPFQAGVGCRDRHAFWEAYAFPGQMASSAIAEDAAQTRPIQFIQPRRAA